MEQPTIATSDAAPTAPVAAVTESAPVTISAERDAANKGDFRAFDEAHSAAQRGKTVARVEATEEQAAPGQATTPTAAASTPALSKRQQEINDRIRDAVQRATAEKDAEIARLRSTAPAAQPAAPAAPAQPAQPTVPEWKRFASMPDAPKLADHDSVEEHAAAMALFIADKRHEERAAAAQHRTEGEQLAAESHQRISAFDARVNELAKTDPAITATILPIAQTLGSKGGPYRVISTLTLDSEAGPQMLQHFAQHPEALERLAVMPERFRGLPARAAVQQHAQWITKELGKLEGQLLQPSAATSQAPAASTISAAPPPPPTLSRAGSPTNPKAAAFARGDFKEWDRIEMQEQLAKRGGSAA